MDQEKLGIFNFFLNNAYKEALHVDVVRVKREQMLVRLEILSNACKDKEYDKAHFILLDVCDKLINDPFSDEYNIKDVEIDMVVFSSAVLSITVKNYQRVEQIMISLIMKYRNPLFYYILGISYFYDTSFKKAQQQFDMVMQLLAENKSLKFPWPNTDVVIIKMGADKIRENALVFIQTLKLLKETKRVNNFTLMESVETIGITKQQNASSNIKIGLGHVIQYDVYPHIQEILSQLVKFDKSKLPAEFRKILSDAAKSNSKVAAPKKQEKSSTSCECKQLLTKNEIVQAEVKRKDAATSTDSNSEKGVSKKHAMVQVQPNTKSKSIQAISSSTHQQTQTREEAIAKSKSEQETISELKARLDQMGMKLKEAEAKLAKNKDIEINRKNKLIAEQQEVISNLKLKLNQSHNQQKELGIKLNKTNGKISEQSRVNKSILAESEKHKKTISELRNYNQMLEKSATDIKVKQDELNSIQKNLFDIYRNAYFVQIQFYQRFHKRCKTMFDVLNNITGYLTEITVPTKLECEKSMVEWATAMLSCFEKLQISKNSYEKYDSYVSYTSLVELAKMPRMMPLEEPKDILLESIPILIHTIMDFDRLFQNSRNKAQEDLNNEATRCDSSREIDYRKKSNFIHKSEGSISSNDDNASSLLEMPSKIKISSKATNSATKSNECSSKFSRSLMTYLKQNISYRTEGDIVNALNICRKNNNGSLSGLTVQYILYNVLKILETPEMAWSAIKDDVDELDDDKEVCPICIEVIRIETKTTLTCRHVYHTECIREWLTVNRVCAVCRNYTVLDDEFPPLKKLPL